MKVFILLLLFVHTFANEIEDFHVDKQYIAKAIMEIVEIYANESFEYFELIQYGNSSGDIFDEIIKNFPLKFLLRNIHNSTAIPINNRVFVILRTFQELFDMLHRLFMDHRFPKPMIVLAYCEESKSFNGFENWLMPIMVSRFIHPILYVLNNIESSIELKTLKFCIPTIECNSKNWETINSFNKSTNSWQKALRIHQKHRDLNGTEIEVRIFPNPPVTRFKLINNNTELDVSGIAPDILRIVARKFNFKIYFQGFEPPKMSTGRRTYPYTRVSVNRTVRDPRITLQIIKITDIEKFTATDELGYTMTQTFMSLNHYYAVTPGDLYSSYEKLVWPFDFETWMFIIGTFGIAFTSIFIINRFDKKIKAVFYGNSINTPSFNIPQIFFGISMSKLPTENFARFILIVFVLYCVVIRAAYQGMLFELLARSHRKPSISDYDSVLLNNYTLYKRNYGITGQGFLEFPLLNKTKVPVYTHLIGSDEEIHKIYATQCENSSARMFLSLSTQHLFMYNEATKQVCPWHLIRKPTNDFAGFGSFPPNHFFFVMLNEIVNEMIPSGIIDHIVRRNHEERYYIPPRAQSHDPLTLDDLGFGFIIWIFSLIPAIVVFLVELTLLPLKTAKSDKKLKIEFAQIHPEGKNIWECYIGHRKDEFNTNAFPKIKLFRAPKYRVVSECNSVVDVAINQ